MGRTILVDGLPLVSGDADALDRVFQTLTEPAPLESARTLALAQIEMSQAANLQRATLRTGAEVALWDTDADRAIRIATIAPHGDLLRSTAALVHRHDMQDVPDDWLVFTSTRPLLGHQTLENGEFIRGRFRAAVDPSDSAVAERYVIENRKLAASLIVTASREEMVAMALLDNRYRDRYLSEYQGEELWDALRSQIEDLSQMEAGALLSLRNKIRSSEGALMDSVRTALLGQPVTAPEQVEEPAAAPAALAESTKQADGQVQLTLTALSESAQVIADMSGLTAEDLRARFDDIPTPNSMKPAKPTTLPLGSVRTLPFGEVDERYVEVLVEIPLDSLVMSEHEQQIRQHPTFARYVEMARAGHEPPAITVSVADDGSLVSHNRRRVLAAREAGLRTIKAWVSPVNAETGLPLKYGELKGRVEALLAATAAPATATTTATTTADAGVREVIEQGAQQIVEPSGVSAGADTREIKHSQSMEELVETLSDQPAPADINQPAAESQQPAIAESEPSSGSEAVPAPTVEQPVTEDAPVAGANAPRQYIDLDEADEPVPAQKAAAERHEGEVLVPMWEMEAFNKRLESLNKKAERFGLDPVKIKSTTTERYYKAYEYVGSEQDFMSVSYNKLKKGEVPPNGEQVVEFNRIDLDYPIIKLGDWQVVAKIEAFTPKENLIFTVTRDPMDNAKAEEHRNCGVGCQHCNTKRARNESFLLRNTADGQYKEVGSTCLQDFTGINPAAVLFLAQMQELVNLSAEFDPESGSGMGRPSAYSTEGYLARVAFCVEQYGWVSSAKAREQGGAATYEEAQFVDRWVADNKDMADAFFSSYERHKATARQVMAWYAEKEPRDSFDRNVKALIGEEFIAIDRKHLAFAAAAVPGYLRHVSEQVNKEAQKPSEYIGEVGDKKGMALTIERASSFPTRYGVSWRINMRDAEGNRLTWKASNPPQNLIENNAVGRPFNAKFTIKELEEYKGERITAVTRLNFEGWCEPTLEERANQALVGFAEILGVTPAFQKNGHREEARNVLLRAADQLADWDKLDPLPLVDSDGLEVGTLQAREHYGYMMPYGSGDNGKITLAFPLVEEAGDLLRGIANDQLQTGKETHDLNIYGPNKGLIGALHIAAPYRPLEIEITDEESVYAALAAAYAQERADGLYDLYTRIQQQHPQFAGVAEEVFATMAPLFELEDSRAGEAARKLLRQREISKQNSEEEIHAVGRDNAAPGGSAPHSGAESQGGGQEPERDQPAGAAGDGAREAFEVIGTADHPEVEQRIRAAIAALPAAALEWAGLQERPVLVRFRSEAELAAMPASLAASLRKAAAVTINKGRIEVINPDVPAGVLTHELAHLAFDDLPDTLRSESRELAIADGAKVVALARRRKDVPEFLAMYQQEVRSYINQVMGKARKGVAALDTSLEFGLMLPNSGLGHFAKAAGLEVTDEQYVELCLHLWAADQLELAFDTKNTREEDVAYRAGANAEFAGRVFHAAADSRRAQLQAKADQELRSARSRLHTAIEHLLQGKDAAFYFDNPRNAPEMLAQAEAVRAERERIVSALEAAGYSIQELAFISKANEAAQAFGVELVPGADMLPVIALHMVQTGQYEPLKPAAQPSAPAEASPVIVTFGTEQTSEAGVIRDRDAWMERNIPREQMDAQRDEGVGVITLDQGSLSVERHAIFGTSFAGQLATQRLVYQMNDGRLTYWDMEARSFIAVDPADDRLVLNKPVAAKAAAEQSNTAGLTVEPLTFEFPSLVDDAQRALLEAWHAAGANPATRPAERAIWLPDMSVAKMEQLIGKEKLSADEVEALKDYKYLLLAQPNDAAEKGFMVHVQADHGGHLAPKNQFWLTNIDHALERATQAAAQEPWRTSILKARKHSQELGLPWKGRPLKDLIAAIERYQNPPAMTEGMHFGEGEVALTVTGRRTTPFPAIKTGSVRAANQTDKAVTRWLMQNALAEAEARGDEYNARMFRANLENPSPADKDSAEMYLTDPATIFPAQQPFLKPLVPEGASVAAAPAPMVVDGEGETRLVRHDGVQEVIPIVAADHSWAGRQLLGMVTGKPSEAELAAIGRTLNAYGLRLREMGWSDDQIAANAHHLTVERYRDLRQQGVITGSFGVPSETDPNSGLVHQYSKQAYKELFATVTPTERPARRVVPELALPAGGEELSTELHYSQQVLNELVTNHGWSFSSVVAGVEKNFGGGRREQMVNPEGHRVLTATFDTERQRYISVKFGGEEWFDMDGRVVLGQPEAVPAFAKQLDEIAAEKAIEKAEDKTTLKVASAAEPQHATVDSADAQDLQQMILIAADSVESLRKIDVYRVLGQSSSAEQLLALGAYISQQRADLAEEVREVSMEIGEERSWALALEAAGQQGSDLVRQVRMNGDVVMVPPAAQEHRRVAAQLLDRSASSLPLRQQLELHSQLYSAARQLRNLGWTDDQIGANAYNDTVEHYRELVREGILTGQFGLPDDVLDNSASLAQSEQPEEEPAQPRVDNQGRNLKAVKAHFEYLARMDEEGRARSAAAFAQQVAEVPLADWTEVNGVRVLRAGQSKYVAVPRNGKETAASFDVIDLEAGELAVQLKRGEVYNWLWRTAKAEHEAALEAAPVEPSAASKPELDRDQLASDFSLRSTEVLEALREKGVVRDLYRLAGVRSADAFSELAMRDQAAAYVHLVESGVEPVVFAEDYNTMAQRLAHESTVRRMQTERSITQANGKPFKTEDTARRMQSQYDLGMTHEIVPDNGGYVLRLLSPAAQHELRNKAAGIESYAEAQSAILREMGIGETEEGEIDATEEQWAEIERRTENRVRAQRGLDPLPEVAAPAVEQAQATPDSIYRALIDRSQWLGSGRVQQFALKMIGGVNTRYRVDVRGSEAIVRPYDIVDHNQAEQPIIARVDWPAEATAEEVAALIRAATPDTWVLEPDPGQPWLWREAAQTEPAGATVATLEETEFGPRIAVMLASLREAGEQGEGMANAMEAGLRADLKNGRLTEAGVAFREQKAHEELAKINNAASPMPVEFKPFTMMTLAVEEPSFIQLPREISAAAIGKLNHLGEQLAQLGFVDYLRVDSTAPKAAKALADQMRNVASAISHLGPARYRIANGHINAKQAKLERFEDFASEQLDIDTRSYPGIRTDLALTAWGVRQSPSKLNSANGQFDFSEESVDEPAATVSPSPQAGARDVSSVAGQMELANRAATIASLKMMNSQLRQIAPGEAWDDRAIEEAADLDALRDSISTSLVSRSRGEVQQAAPVDPLRQRLESASGQDLREVFDRLNLAGARMTHSERVDCLLAEDREEVEAALDALEADLAVTAIYDELKQNGWIGGKEGGQHALKPLQGSAAGKLYRVDVADGKAVIRPHTEILPSKQAEQPVVAEIDLVGMTAAQAASAIRAATPDFWKFVRDEHQQWLWVEVPEAQEIDRSPEGDRASAVAYLRWLREEQGVDAVERVMPGIHGSKTFQTEARGFPQGHIVVDGRNSFPLKELWDESLIAGLSLAQLWDGDKVADPAQQAESLPSEQFGNYLSYIRDPQTPMDDLVSTGLREHIRMDERMKDGEDAVLLSVLNEVVKERSSPAERQESQAEPDFQPMTQAKVLYLSVSPEDWERIQKTGEVAMERKMFSTRGPAARSQDAVFFADDMRSRRIAQGGDLFRRAKAIVRAEGLAEEIRIATHRVTQADLNANERALMLGYESLDDMPESAQQADEQMAALLAVVKQHEAELAQVHRDGEIKIADKARELDGEDEARGHSAVVLETRPLSSGNVYTVPTLQGNETSYGFRNGAVKLGDIARVHYVSSGTVVSSEELALSAPAAEAQQEEKPIKWFGSEAKAQTHINVHSLKGSHEIVQNGRRFEIREKAAPVVAELAKSGVSFEDAMRQVQAQPRFLASQFLTALDELRPDDASDDASPAEIYERLSGNWPELDPAVYYRMTEIEGGQFILENDRYTVGGRGQFSTKFASADEARQYAAEQGLLIMGDAGASAQEGSDQLERIQPDVSPAASDEAYWITERADGKVIVENEEAVIGASGGIGERTFATRGEAIEWAAENGIAIVEQAGADVRAQTLPAEAADSPAALIEAANQRYLDWDWERNQRAALYAAQKHDEPYDPVPPTLPVEFSLTKANEYAQVAWPELVAKLGKAGVERALKDAAETSALEYVGIKKLKGVEYASEAASSGTGRMDIPYQTFSRASVDVVAAHLLLAPAASQHAAQHQVRVIVDGTAYAVDLEQPLIETPPPSLVTQLLEQHKLVDPKADKALKVLDALLIEQKQQVAEALQAGVVVPEVVLAEYPALVRSDLSAAQIEQMIKDVREEHAGAQPGELMRAMREWQPGLTASKQLEALPVFATYQDAREWVIARRAQLGMDSHAYSSTDEYQNLKDQLQAISFAENAKSDTRRSELLAQAGVEVGERVEMVVPVAGEDKAYQGVLTRRGSALVVKLDAPMPVTKASGQASVTEVPWDGRWRKAGGPAAGAHQGEQPKPAVPGAAVQIDSQADLWRAIKAAWDARLGNSGTFVCGQECPAVLNVSGSERRFTIWKDSGAGPIKFRMLKESKQGLQFEFFKLGRDGQIDHTGTKNLWALTEEAQAIHLAEFNAVFAPKPPVAETAPVVDAPAFAEESPSLADAEAEWASAEAEWEQASLWGAAEDEELHAPAIRAGAR